LFNFQVWTGVSGACERRPDEKLNKLSKPRQQRKKSKPFSNVSAIVVGVAFVTLAATGASD
jgi:hypothetical protein